MTPAEKTIHQSVPVTDAYAAELVVADEHLAQGERRQAAKSFAAAMRAAMHRALHFDAMSSPLATGRAEFVEPLVHSEVARALRAPRGRAVGADASASTPGSPTRVLVVTRKNTNFLGEILDLLGEEPNLDGRLFSFADEGDIVAEVAGVRRMAKELLTGKAGLAERAEEFLRPHLDWADVVFVEWCTAHAVVFNLVDPRDTRVVVRLHSYEAFTPWPHMIDFSRVDDVLFVSEHLRDFAVDAIPALREPNAPALAVLPLSLRLQAYARPKADEARFALGLVGWGSVAKDPLWALDVLKAVRATDPRYRLVLVGDEFDMSVSEAARKYGEKLEAALAPLEAEGAVVRHGRTEDVPAALAEIGVMLSTSVRESFHAGLVEGAASGAVPVVRDWPFFAGHPTSARTLFPADWVVDTPEQAAERILRTTATDEEWRRAGQEAAQHALTTWDWDNVRGAYVEFLSRRRGQD